ncbi:MAG: hypothetical protein NVS3B20_14400 [Polyangiales bacterium]
MPSAETAVARLDATYASVSGFTTSAKIDYLGDRGRVRGDLSILASGPSSLRFLVVADVIGAAGEVASNGIRFQADDKAHGRYIVGPAKPCNIARITQVPLPSEELVPMLWGMRPQIPGPISCAGIEWDGRGYYVVMTRGGAKASLSHELHLAPIASDFTKPYAEQRMHLLGVVGWAGDALVYRVTMKDHVSTHTAQPIVDPTGVSATVPSSGPDVTVDIPRTIHVEVPAKKSDVVLRYGDDTAVNPPLIPNAFELVLRKGIATEESDCE